MQTFKTQKGNITLAYENEVSLTIIDRSVDLDEWTEMLTIAKENAVAKVRVVIVWVREGEITADQRRVTAAETAQFANHPLAALALLSDSMLVRGAMTAYGWLVRGATTYRAFSPRDVDGAIAWASTFATFDHDAARAFFKA